MLTENAKFKHYSTDKTVVHVSNEPNMLIIDRIRFYLVHLGCWYHVGEKNGRQMINP